MTAAVPTTVTLPPYQSGTCRRWTGGGWCGNPNVVGVWQLGPLCREHAPEPTPRKIPGCECPQCRPEPTQNPHEDQPSTGAAAR